MATDLLFSEPNAEQLVSGGFHHEWPDARGVFFNTNRDVLAWVNQEDHVRTPLKTPFRSQPFCNTTASSVQVRIFTMEMGGNLKRAFGRLAKFMAGFERRITKQKKELMHSERLGYISTDPGNLGTGLRVTRDSTESVYLSSLRRSHCLTGVLFVGLGASHPAVADAHYER